MTGDWQWKMYSGVVFLNFMFHTKQTPSGSLGASSFWLYEATNSSGNWEHQSKLVTARPRLHRSSMYVPDKARRRPLLSSLLQGKGKRVLGEAARYLAHLPIDALHLSGIVDKDVHRVSAAECPLSNAHRSVEELSKRFRLHEVSSFFFFVLKSLGHLTLRGFLLSQQVVLRLCRADHFHVWERCPVGLIMLRLTSTTSLCALTCSTSVGYSKQ